MRHTRIKKISAITLFGGLYLLFYFLQYTRILPAIGYATVAPLVPITVLAAVQFKEWPAALFGMFGGFLMDIMGTESPCFYTITLFLLGCFAGLLVKYYVNTHPLSVMALIGLFSLLFFAAKWLTFYTNHPQAGQLLLWALASAVYTAAVGILLYFLLRLVFRRQEVKRI